MAGLEREEGFQSEPDISSDNMEDDPIFSPEEIQSQNDGPGALGTDSQQPEASAPAPTKEKKRLRGERADVWKHFRRGDDKPDGHYDAFCLYCKWVCEMGKQKSTSSMHHHVDKGCKKIPSDKRHKPSALQKMLQNACQKGKPSPSVWHFDQAKCRKSFAEMVIVHEYPFNCVTYHYLRAFLNDIQPQFKLVSRNTLRSDCINIYEEEQKNLYEQLGKLECKMSFTSDLWSNSARDRGFMSLTCHFIDDSWQLRKRILNFSILPSPHTGKNIAEAIHHRLVLWNLDQRCFTLTLDNATSNDACVRELLSIRDFKSALAVDGNIFHQRCSCHILNLIVQDGLEVIGDIVAKVRETMKYLKYSQGRAETFKLASSQVNITTNKIPMLDVATRWNSTYLMLDLALQLKPAIVRYASLDKKYVSHLEENDWDTVGAFVTYLKVFYDATLKLSGTQYPTLNLFFPEYCEVYLTIKSMESSPVPCVVQMSKEMFKKWNKYFTGGNTLLAMACILDPRCKMVVVEYYFEKLYQLESEGIISSIKDCLSALFQEYLEAASKSSTARSSTQVMRIGTTSHSNSVSDTRAGLKDFMKGKKMIEPTKTDLETYLADPLDDASLDEPFDILAWWKINAPKYPILAKLCRDMLAVPISTVASEGCFSTSGRTLSSVRNSLNNESMEALICCQDWLRAKIIESGADVGDTMWVSEEATTVSE